MQSNTKKVSFETSNGLRYIGREDAARYVDFFEKYASPKVSAFDAEAITEALWNSIVQMKANNDNEKLSTLSKIFTEAAKKRARFNEIEELANASLEAGLVAMPLFTALLSGCALAFTAISFVAGFYLPKILYSAPTIVGFGAIISLGYVGIGLHEKNSQDYKNLMKETIEMLNEHEPKVFGNDYLQVTGAPRIQRIELKGHNNTVSNPNLHRSWLHRRV